MTINILLKKSISFNFKNNNEKIWKNYIRTKKPLSLIIYFQSVLDTLQLFALMRII